MEGWNGEAKDQVPVVIALPVTANAQVSQWLYRVSNHWHCLFALPGVVVHS